ncbi:MAG: nuclear transport factor 2 family protein [Nitrososphaeraceae archaeon]
MGNKISLTDQILKSNAEFYHAFEMLSIDMMDNLWKHDENVICVHPGWELLIGWLAIRESWITIFQNTEMIKFNITNTKVRLSDSSDMGVVVCQENIESSVNGHLQDRIGVIATNIFERSGNRWLLIHHQGSSISNYMPPNLSPQ